MIENKLLFFLENNKFAFTVFVLIVASIIRGRYTSIYTHAIIHFIGTFAHELAHLSVSILLNGKPNKISLFPKLQGNTIELGYVSNTNITWYNAFPIAFAPLALLVGAYFVEKYFFVYFDKNILSFFIYIFLISILTINSIPSYSDLKIGVSSAIGFILYLGLVILFFKGVYT